jgi:hypothetical protein
MNGNLIIDNKINIIIYIKNRFLNIEANISLSVFTCIYKSWSVDLIWHEKWSIKKL